MRTKAPSGPAVVAFVLLLIGGAASSQAQQITQHTIDAGGGRSSGGGYVIEGTFGQPDAGVSTASGYRLQSGFWTTRAALADVVFADGFE